MQQGPKVIRRRLRGSETEVAREIRLAQHEPATVLVVGGGLAGFSAAIEAAKYVQAGLLISVLCAFVSCLLCERVNGEKGLTVYEQ